MTFPATISITVATGDTIVLDRIGDQMNSSEYVFSDANRGANLKIRHSTDPADADGIIMKRHNVFFEYVVYPTPTAAVKKFTTTVTMRAGRFDDPAYLAVLGKNVATWITSGTVAADLSKGIN